MKVSNQMNRQQIEAALGEGQKVKAGTRRAIRTFARSGAWRGSVEERQAKFTALNQQLSLIHGVECELVFINTGPTSSLESTIQGNGPGKYRILLQGRLSVITYLCLFAKVAGLHEGMRWALNLFRRHFPQTWQRLEFDGTALVNATRQSDTEEVSHAE